MKRFIGLGLIVAVLAGVIATIRRRSPLRRLRGEQEGARSSESSSMVTTGDVQETADSLVMAPAPPAHEQQRPEVPQDDVPVKSLPQEPTAAAGEERT
jgi:hypothetical protein